MINHRLFLSSIFFFAFSSPIFSLCEPQVNPLESPPSLAKSPSLTKSSSIVRKTSALENPSLDSPSSVIEFQNSIIYFQASKSKTNFTFSDNLGFRELKINNCNKKNIEKFWNELVNHINSIQSSKINQEKASKSKSWVKYDGITFPLLDFESARSFFNKVPNNSHVLFTESRRPCSK